MRCRFSEAQSCFLSAFGHGRPAHACNNQARLRGVPVHFGCSPDYPIQFAGYQLFRVNAYNTIAFRQEPTRQSFLIFDTNISKTVNISYPLQTQLTDYPIPSSFALAISGRLSYPFPEILHHRLPLSRFQLTAAVRRGTGRSHQRCHESGTRKQTSSCETLHKPLSNRIKHNQIH
jgi:hypothetical protein